MRTLFRAPMVCCMFMSMTLFLLPALVHAAEVTNPDGTTLGTWDGTADDDTYTNKGTADEIDMSQGGSDAVYNIGTVNSVIKLSDTKNNYVENTGTINGIRAMNNVTEGNEAGNNEIVNSGTIGMSGVVANNNFLASTFGNNSSFEQYRYD